MYVQKLPIIIITKKKKKHVNLVFIINFLWYPTLRTSISLSWMSHLLVNSLWLWMCSSFFFFMFCPKIRFVSLGLPHTWTQVRFHLGHLIFYPFFQKRNIFFFYCCITGDATLRARWSQDHLSWNFFFFFIYIIILKKIYLSTFQKKFENTLNFFYVNKIKFCFIICSTFSGWMIAWLCTLKKM